MFIVWTDGIDAIVSDYVHFNTICLHILLLVNRVHLSPINFYPAALCKIGVFR